MEKEYLLNKSNEITLNVTDGKVDSYREKDETQSTVRVYDNGTIGVAGALGYGLGDHRKQAQRKRF